MDGGESSKIHGGFMVVCKVYELWDVSCCGCDIGDELFIMILIMEVLCDVHGGLIFHIEWWLFWVWRRG